MEIQTKMKENSFAPKFGSWWERIRPFWAKGGFDPIYAFLKAEAGKNKQIAPASMNTFRTFLETPYSELKAVIVCQDPYAKFISNEPIASGVAMDCSITARIQPTLQQFYNGIEVELYNGLNMDYVDTYDLSYLSKQGVLMLNTALTVERDKPGSHMAVWSAFTTFLFTEVIGPTGVPVIFLGKDAAALSILVDKTNHVFKASHPVAASYSGKKWDTQGIFTEINRTLEESNNESIMWLNIETPF